MQIGDDSPTGVGGPLPTCVAVLGADGCIEAVGPRLTKPVMLGNFVVSLRDYRSTSKVLLNP